MIKIFISQPMSGKTDAEILKEREEIKQFALEKFKGEEILFIDSFIKNAEAEHPLWCLGKSLEQLAQANYAIFSPDWKEARGCVIEHMACLYYYIPTYEIPPREG